jgi:hypothetical protein
VMIPRKFCDSFLQAYHAWGQVEPEVLDGEV